MITETRTAIGSETSRFAFRHSWPTKLTRRRYWARSLIGWRRFGQAEPNDAHRL
jgi:hypothetical protein